MATLLEIQAKEKTRAELAKKINGFRQRLKDGADKPVDQVITAEERQELERICDEERSLDREIKDLRLRLDLEQRDETERQFNVEQQRRGLVPRNQEGEGPFARGGDGASTELRAEQRALALQAYFRAGADMPLKKAHREACKAVKFNPDQRRFRMRLWDSSQYKRFREAVARGQEFRAMTTTTGSSGGFLIVDEFLAGYERVILENAPMMRLARVIRTMAGGDLPLVDVTDGSNTGEQLAESTSIGASVDPTVNQMVLKAWKFSSKPILVPYELLEDDAYGFINELQDLTGQRVGRILNTKFTTGAGTTTPKGVVTSAAAGITAAAVAAITASEIKRLKRSVKKRYRDRGAFMAHSDTITAMHLMQDDVGQFLWQPSLREGMPGTIDGSPYEENDDMATMAASAVSLLFGDFSQYTVRQVRDNRQKRLDERYADLDQVAFIMFGRYDGQLRMAADGSVKKLTQAAS